MSQHYHENLIGSYDWKWCGTCRKITEHAIVRHSEHAGVLGHCLQHQPKPTKKEQNREARKEYERQNPRLF